MVNGAANLTQRGEDAKEKQNKPLTICQRLLMISWVVELRLVRRVRERGCRLVYQTATPSVVSSPREASSRFSRSMYF